MFNGIPPRERIKLRLRDAYLSVKNVDSVYSSIVKVLKDKHGCTLGSTQYRKETLITMERVFAMKISELTDNHLQNPKETIYMLDAMAIERVVATLVEMFHALRNRPTLSAPDVFDRPAKKPKKHRQQVQLPRTAWKTLGPNGQLPPLLPVPPLLNTNLPSVQNFQASPQVVVGQPQQLQQPFQNTLFQPEQPFQSAVQPTPNLNIVQQPFQPIPSPNVVQQPHKMFQICIDSMTAFSKGSRGFEYDFGHYSILKLLLVGAQATLQSKPASRVQNQTLTMLIGDQTIRVEYTPQDLQTTCRMVEKSICDQTSRPFSVSADDTNRVTIEGPEIFSILLSDNKQSAAYFGFKQMDHIGKQIYAGSVPAGSLPSQDLGSVHLITSITTGPIAPIPILSDQRGHLRAERAFNNLKFWFSDVGEVLERVRFSFQDDEGRPIDIDTNGTCLYLRVVLGQGKQANETDELQVQSQSQSHSFEPPQFPKIEEIGGVAERDMVFEPRHNVEYVRPKSDVPDPDPQVIPSLPNKKHNDRPPWMEDFIERKDSLQSLSL